jgi:hypothetical protein
MYVAIVSIEMRLSPKGINKCVGKYNITWVVHIVVEFSTDGGLLVPTCGKGFTSVASYAC